MKFFVRDPKFRVINKAAVRDRVVHQALHDELCPVFEKQFIFDSYSSLLNKGVLKAVLRAERFCRMASDNLHRPLWIFHGDIENFFASIRHEILFARLAVQISDENYLRLSREIIDSYSDRMRVGLPLGNLTSQLFANVYLHEFDYFVKQKLRVDFYLRYNDDFFVFANDRIDLLERAKAIQNFLRERLALSMPDAKINIRNINSGVDVLGMVLFPWLRIPRQRLRRRSEKAAAETRREGYCLRNWRRSASYLGLLHHCRSFLLQEKLRLSAVDFL